MKVGIYMKIGIGNDHHGLKIKNKLVKYLTKKGYEVINYGTDTKASVDYPDYAFQVGKAVSTSEVDLGILICKTGIGMSIACNRVKGARCAKVATLKETKLARLHNNANVIALSGDMSVFKAKDLVDLFVKTKYSNEERHNRRISKLDL